MQPVSSADKGGLTLGKSLGFHLRSAVLDDSHLRRLTSDSPPPARPPRAAAVRAKYVQLINRPGNYNNRTTVRENGAVDAVIALKYSLEIRS